MALLARSTAWAKPFVTVPCLPWGAGRALARLSLEQAELAAPFSVPEPLPSLGVAHPMSQLHGKHGPFCITTVLSPQPGLEELGGSLLWGVPGQSCIRCPGKAFAHRRESNRSV